MRQRTPAPDPFDADVSLDTDADDASPDALADAPMGAPAAAQKYVPRLSKTQLKTQSHELQQLGAEVAALPESRLADVPMPESLRDAIAQYRRTKSHEGRRRQMQLIGKQMRFAEPEPLREAVASFKLGSARDTLALHQAEAWRDDLIANDGALTRWAQAYPRSDLQQLRSLVRAARKAALEPAQPGQSRNGRAFRELFQFVKPWLQAAIPTTEVSDSDERDD